MAFRSLGLAILVGSAMTTSAAEPASQSQAVAQTIARPIAQIPAAPQSNNQEENAIADDHEPAGKVHLTRGNPEPPAFISISDHDPHAAVSSANACPPAEGEIAVEVNRIEREKALKPIGMLRADRRMRLANQHSLLWKPADESDDGKRAATRERVLTHEKVRCSVEEERQAIREQFKANYGPYVDRSAGLGSDENVAPLFPYTYYPLYFEDPNLERCGYSLGCCAQPFVSAAHFYGNVALLPVKMLVICPWECVYPRPDCEPCTRHGYCDNMLGPCPETTGWGCFRSRRCTCNSCKNGSW